MLTEAILSAIVEAVAGRILSLGERRGPGESRFSLAGAREAVVGHLDFVQNWSRQISFLELRRPKPLSSAFVNLDLYLGMKRHSEGAPERMVRVSELLGLPGNLVILGDPGGGKTTSLKRVAQDALAALAVSGGAPRLVPFVIRLRDLEREGRDEE
ncbi:MAG TPA: hypothetical protein VFQ39_05805, partial [Longimicrobium sp.]|nr:hypothetical protein [Longimicrobium sp.]